MGHKTEMRAGFEAQRKVGMDVDWFTWQIAWHDALFTMHDVPGGSAKFDVSMLQLGRMYETKAYGTVRLDRWDTYSGQTTAEIVLENGERRNPLPGTLADEIEAARRDAAIEKLQAKFPATERPAPIDISLRLEQLLADAERAGVKIEVWLESQKPLAMGNTVMRSSVRPATYDRVETHAEKANG